MPDSANDRYAESVRKLGSGTRREWPGRKANGEDWRKPKNEDKGGKK